MLGICQAYVLGICICDTCNNSLIRIALSVVWLLLELLEVFEVLSHFDLGIPMMMSH